MYITKYNFAYDGQLCASSGMYLLIDVNYVVRYGDRCRYIHVVDNVHNFINDQIREQDGNSIELKVRPQFIILVGNLRNKLTKKSFTFV